MSSVLIVDDSPADRALFRTLLTRGGFAVHEVAYGRDVRPKLREARPAAMILDLNLPDTDGLSVCREVRADPEFAGLPILILTVQGDERSVLAGLDAGADDYVAKDSPAEVVLARVRRLVRYRQMTRVAALNEGLVQVGRLLAGIVHEIRGPVSVIRGNAELIRMERPDDRELLDRVDPIVRACQLLQVRLEHLMATVRSGPPVLEPIDLPGLVEEVAELFRKGTDPRNSRVLVETTREGRLPLVPADAGRLMQVLLNLLANAHEAIAVSGHGGRIELRVASAPGEGEDGDGVAIEVRDDGPGIPADLLGRIFDPFVTTKADGTGYGLYLAGEIVREHGGRISAENRPDGGACLRVWLPLTAAGTRAPVAR
jgi:signal transduction histidine kinase